MSPCHPKKEMRAHNIAFLATFLIFDVPFGIQNVPSFHTKLAINGTQSSSELDKSCIMYRQVGVGYSKYDFFWPTLPLFSSNVIRRTWQDGHILCHRKSLEACRRIESGGEVDHVTSEKHWVSKVSRSEFRINKDYLSFHDFYESESFRLHIFFAKCVE